MTQLNSWMQRHFEVLQNLPFPSLLLPGTHDSGAYAFSSRCISPKARDRWLSWIAAAARPIVKAWTVAQALTVRQQLDCGVRFLDLRVSCCFFGGCGSIRNRARISADALGDASCSFWVSHTFACAPLEDVISQVCSFLDDTSHEMVVLRIEPDWQHRDDLMEPAHACLLCELLADRLSSYAFDHADLKPGQWPTLGAAVSPSYRICPCHWPCVRGGVGKACKHHA